MKIINPEFLNLLEDSLKIKPKSEELPYYESPEALAGTPSLLSPMWSLGVIIHMMISGKQVIDGKTEDEIKEKIKKGKIKIRTSAFSNKPDCKDFILKLLTAEKDRMTPEAALNHPWILKNTEEFSKDQELLSKEVVMNLLRFSSMDNLKRMILGLLVTTMKDNQLENVTKTFISLDKNGDGKLSKEEIKFGLKEFEDSEKLMDLLEKADNDSNGFIDYHEFCMAAVGYQLCTSKEKLIKAFSYLDKNKNGYLERIEFLELLMPYSNGMSKAEIAEIIMNSDLNNDGKISLEEAVSLMRIKKE